MLRLIGQITIAGAIVQKIIFRMQKHDGTLLGPNGLIKKRQGTIESAVEVETR